MADKLQTGHIQHEHHTDSNMSTLSPLTTANEPMMPTMESVGSTLTLLQALDRYKSLKEREDAQAVGAVSKGVEGDDLGEAGNIKDATKVNESFQGKAAEKQGPCNGTGRKRPNQCDELPQSQSCPSKRANRRKLSPGYYPTDCENEDDEEELPSGSRSEVLSTGNVCHLFPVKLGFRALY